MSVCKNVVVFLGSVREGRFGERVAKLVCETLKKNNVEPILFDPEVMDFPLLKLPLQFMPDQSKAPQWLRDANEKIQKADGFVIVSPEYNCAVPPALSNMMDHFPPDSYRHRPCAICVYSLGPFGGIRLTTSLRPFIAELGMISTPTPCVFATVQNAVNEQGEATGEDHTRRVEKLVTELKWYASAIKQQKDSVGNPSS